eukprot:TRINITY_DN3819_c0_g1_i1.p1 TRINITY_DN3819_c0_g1~~TRINITY_DN3819_c0_g1_i1.p1  ORF type:complete len:285 (-),score=50.43 TRINITY_DN3819_c0_g1_i1:93-947(-)
MRLACALVVGRLLQDIAAIRLSDEQGEDSRRLERSLLAARGADGAQRRHGHERLRLVSAGTAEEDAADELAEFAEWDNPQASPGGWSKDTRREMMGSPYDDGRRRTRPDSGERQPKERRRPSRQHQDEGRSPHDEPDETASLREGSAGDREGDEDRDDRDDRDSDYDNDYYGDDHGGKKHFAEQYEEREWTYRDHGKNEKHHHSDDPEPGSDARRHHDDPEPGHGSSHSLFSGSETKDSDDGGEHKHHSRRHEGKYRPGPDHDGDYHGTYDNPGHHHPGDVHKI